MTEEECLLNPKAIKVIGLGNVLCQDDGLGVYAVERLEEALQDNEELVQDFTLVKAETDAWYGLQECLTSWQVIIIDALLGPGEPGTVYIVPLQEIVDTEWSYSMHGLTLLQLIARYQKEGKAIKGWLIGMEPERIDLGFGLSPVVEDNMEILLEEVKIMVERMQGQGLYS
ncbi:hydrogenase maturation protease [Heliorestis convoluta]|uniref:Hydrogenase maturation protease n=1 Tax=Heliorestis convoluta TaxID=356322 RepID=A0A5Q2N0Z7_9FIRM|nr:hydrogenase maturation protease [Heliorestis convoluta]QGG49034.1 Hydrogenase maturation protease [Heliorestis convoluta]